MKIDRRYCGPPDSAHGGVSVGRFAEVAGGGPIEVRLMAPPPLDTDLSFRHGDDDTVVFSGPDGDVARLRRLSEPVSVAPFALVAETDLAAAAAMYLDDVDEHGHPFPTCFGCGPDRDEGDGLRQFAGPVTGGSTVAARFHVAGEGPLADWMCWAGLDCPSAGALGFADDPPSVILLGTMAGQVHGPVLAGVDYQVRARLIASEGRKHTTEVVMLDPDGAVVGAARAVWIAIDPDSP